MGLVLHIVTRGAYMLMLAITLLSTMCSLRLLRTSLWMPRPLLEPPSVARWLSTRVLQLSPPPSLAPDCRGSILGSHISSTWYSLGSGGEGRGVGYGVQMHTSRGIGNWGGMGRSRGIMGVCGATSTGERESTSKRVRAKSEVQKDRGRHEGAESRNTKEEERGQKENKMRRIKCKYVKEISQESSQSDSCSIYMPAMIFSQLAQSASRRT